MEQDEAEPGDEVCKKSRQGTPESTDEVGEATYCGVGMASNPNALSGGAPRVGVSGSQSVSSLNMGEWYNGLCISLRPNESSWKASTPAGEFSVSGIGSFGEDTEAVSNELECIEVGREPKSSRLARSGLVDSQRL